MKLLLIAILSLSLTACCNPEIMYVDQIVEVPVIISEPAPKLPHVEPLGKLPIDYLHRESTFEEAARAYVKTVEIQDNKLRQYKEALSVPND